MGPVFHIGCCPSIGPGATTAAAINVVSLPTAQQDTKLCDLCLIYGSMVDV